MEARIREEYERKEAERRAEYEEAIDARYVREMDARIEAMRVKMETKVRAEIEASMLLKPAKKAREPKAPTYWEGQVETEGGWKFDSLEMAIKYGETLPKGEAMLFIGNWNQTYAEKKEKKSIKNRDYDARDLPANETATRCSANLWNNGNGCRCRRNGNKTSIDWKGEEVYMCDQHFKNIKENLDKWKLWEEVCGKCAKNGWWDDEDWKSKMSRAEKGGKKADWVAPTRGKKV